MLENALRIFAKMNYEKASQTEIAKACGLSKAGLIYYLEYRGYFLFHVRVVHAGLHQQVVVIEIETASHRIAAIIERGDELSHSPFHSCIPF